MKKVYEIKDLILKKIKTYIKNITYNKNIKSNLLFVFCFTSAIFIPDLILKIFYNVHITFEGLFFLGIVAFSLFLSFTNKIVFLSFAIIIFTMQMIQLNYIAFFGTPIEPMVLLNIFREKKDTFDLTYLKQTWLVIFPTIFLFGLSVYIFLKKKNMIKVGFIWLLIIFVAGHKPYRAYTKSKGVWYFQPSATRSSLKNSINTFSYFVFQYYPMGYNTLSINYIPYSFEKKHSDTKNILVIFGESLYSEHINIYGYKRNTFPLITERFKNDKNWDVYSAMSPGIATATSTLLFFNLVREPANHNEIKLKTNNLFKLAKMAGYKTYYFSNQESRLTMNLGAEYIDEIATHDSKPLFFNLYQDEGLAKMLNDIDFSKGKNFIVLHIRTPHLPYENRYKKRPEFRKFIPDTNTGDRLLYMTNTYDNALLYTDFVLNEMINNFEKKTDSKTSSIYITADHGQLFNYNGMWAHNNLVLEQAKVPFFTRNNLSNKNKNNIVSYYEIGKMIADDLGYNVINKNEEDNTYYLHGNNIDFAYDFIKYKIENNKVVKILKENTSQLKNNLKQ